MNQSEFHPRRIEMAHRKLMSACRTLAKVRRADLPDVLALVNVTPPWDGGLTTDRAASPVVKRGR